MDDVHLVVLQHGLWGHPDNLAFVQDCFLRHADSCTDLSCPVRTINSPVNYELLTYDGVDLCGDRVVTLIKDTIDLLATRDHLRVTKLSLLGYSLGGLIMRYVVGRLEYEGMFTDGGIKPVNFITVATPHLGTVRVEQSMYNRLYNRMVPTMSSRSGYQLVLADEHALGRPLLINLCDPSLVFMRGLSRFQKLMALGNIRGDQMVPFTSATLRADDPYQAGAWSPRGFRAEPAADADKYPNVCRPCTHGGDGATAAAATHRGCADGWGVAVLVLLLLPVFLLLLALALCYIAYKGTQHYRMFPADRVPFAWVEEDAAATHVGDGDGDGTTDNAVTVDAVQLQVDVTPGDDPDGSKAKLADHDAAALGKPGGTPAEQVAWMLTQLNKLPWLRVDVDCRHMHAHAAIVLRRVWHGTRFSIQDHLQYMLDHMHW